MRTTVLAMLLLIGALFFGDATAALFNRGNGLIYDSDLNITWLSDANYAKTSDYDGDGRMTWADAKIWADNVVYAGFSDWRLPSTTQPDPNCQLQMDYGPPYGLQGFLSNCTASEMGHLFYNELGGVALNPINTTHNASYDLFQNIQADDVQGEGLFDNYWSGTSFAPSISGAWLFNFSNGRQNALGTDNGFFAWAVRSGDVPEPNSLVLATIALAAFCGSTRRPCAVP